MALKLYNSYQAEIKEHLTQDYLRDLKVVKLALFGFVIILFLGLIGNVFRIVSKFESSPINQGIEMTSLLLINIFLFLGLKLPIEIKELSFDDDAYHRSSAAGKKYLKSRLSVESKNSILESLNHTVHENKYYRTPNLTINDLSQELNIQSKHLSQVINENHDQNFCDYINSLRIEDAKAQLRDGDLQQKTILEICYEIGFNSKSTFNAVFKKQTGFTPSAYRRSHKTEH